MISNLQAMARRFTCSQNPSPSAGPRGRDKDRRPRLVNGIFVTPCLGQRRHRAWNPRGPHRRYQAGLGALRFWDGGLGWGGDCAPGGRGFVFFFWPACAPGRREDSFFLARLRSGRREDSFFRRPVALTSSADRGLGDSPRAGIAPQTARARCGGAAGRRPTPHLRSRYDLPRQKGRALGKGQTPTPDGVGTRDRLQGGDRTSMTHGL